MFYVLVLHKFYIENTSHVRRQILADDIRHLPVSSISDIDDFSSDLILIKIFLSKIRTVIEERLNALCFVEILEAYSENSRLSLNYEPTTSPNSASTKRRAS